MKHWLTVITCVTGAIVTSANAGEVQDLKQRIQQLEQETKQLQERQSQLEQDIGKATDASAVAQDTALDLDKHAQTQLKVSGYAHLDYMVSSLPDSHPSVSLHHFSMFLTKQFDPSWKFFSEIEYEDAPRIEFESGSPDCQGDCSGEIFVEAVNIDYAYRDYLGFRFGRFFTPAGIWSIDHYPPFVATEEVPLHIYALFPQLVDGLLAYGTVRMKDTFVAYDLYTGNGESTNGKEDNNDDKAFGARIDVNFPVLTHCQVGVSYYQDTLGDPGNEGTQKNSAGIHAKLKAAWLDFQGEYATAQVEPIGSPDYTMEGYYAQIAANVAALSFGYRYDFFQSYDTALLAETETTRNSLFANYRVQKDIVVKLEHHVTEPQDAAKYNLTIASIAVFLGN